MSERRLIYCGSEEIRKLVFALREKKLIGAEGQMTLFFAARKFWVDSLVKPSINKGVSVLGDRSYTSTGAYQGYAEGGSQKQILGIADIVMGKFKPDAVILFDVSVETSMKRRSDPDGDPFDKKDREYFDRIIKGYRRMAKMNWGDLKWFVVSGEPNPEVVSESVAEVLEKIFEKKLER